MVGRVQECGCIALPEELQAETGLYPGATYEIEVSSQGTGIILRPVDRQQSADLKPGTRCA